MTSALHHDERRAWTALLLLGLAALIGLHALGFAIRWRATALPLGSASGLAAIGWFYRARGRSERVAATCVALAQLVVMSLIAAALSYGVACLDYPLRDAALARMDQALGFDWRAMVRAADAHPGFARLLKAAYDTLLPQMAAVLLVLGFGGQLRPLRMMTWAAGLSAVATVLVSAVVPAVGYYVHLGLSPTAFPHVRPAAAFDYLGDFTRLRSGGLRLLDATALQGIITFPSFHVALATLFAWGFWQNRLARWPGLAFEALVVMSTPIDGGHYLVDMIAGALVTVAAIVAAGRIVAFGRVMPLTARTAGAIRLVPLAA